MIKILSFFSTLLLACNISFALPFTITPSPGTTLPTTVYSGQTTIALYTVTNNTGRTRVNNYVKYLPPNVTQVTTDPMYPDLCGSRFTLKPRGVFGSSCTLELKITGKVNANDPDPHHHLFVCFPGGITCAGTPDPLNVSLSKLRPYTRAYVVNQTNSTILLCSINSSTGAFSHCVDSGGNGFDGPIVITFNAAGTRAYVSNAMDNTILLCAVDRSTGLLSNCVNAGGSGLNMPVGITFNKSGNSVYVVNLFGNNVLICAVNQTTGMLSDCTDSGGTGFDIPAILTFNTSETRAYVSNNGASTGTTVTLCDVVGATGQLTNCTDSGGTGFMGPAGVTLDVSNRFIYVGNSNAVVDYISMCAVNMMTGLLNNCVSIPNALFMGPSDVALNPFHNVAYVSNNGGSTVALCSVNSATGALSNCRDSGVGAIFDNPTIITLR